MHRKLILYFLLIVLSLSFYSNISRVSGSNSPIIRDLMNNYQQELDISYLDTVLDDLNLSDFRNYVEVLATNYSKRSYGSTANIDTSKWLTSTLTKESNGNISIELIGSYRSILAKLSANVEINPRMGSRKAIVFSAHFDSVSTTPGADDNGSGVAYLLFLAKYFSNMNYDLVFDIYFAFCNAEEIGLLGSEQIAQLLKIRVTDVLININADMILYGTPDVYYSPNGGMMNGKYFAMHMKAISNNYNFGLINIQEAGEFWDSSDHYSFFSAGFPAITIHESNINQNPYYHGRSDVPTASGYNYTHALLLVQATILSILDWSYSYLTLHDLHFYQYQLHNETSFEFVIPSDSYLSEIIFQCVEVSECSLTLEKMYDSIEFFMENLVLVDEWNTVNLSKGFYRLSSDSSVEVTQFIGLDSDSDTSLDFFDDLSLDYYRDIVDYGRKVPDWWSSAVTSDLMTNTTIRNDKKSVSVESITLETLGSISSSDKSVSFAILPVLIIVIFVKAMVIKKRKNN